MSFRYFCGKTLKAMSQTRRQFLATSAKLAGTTCLLCSPRFCASSVDSSTSIDTGSALKSNSPWYRRVLRWGQTNITEADAANYDVGWWRDYWKRTRVQGVIINAGGIVAYYQS